MANSYIWFFCFVLTFFSHGILLEIEASHVVFERNLESLQPDSPSQTYRTSYHFQPPKNWMNDPNGPLVYKGLYHLFYQYNPSGADWGNIVWAHSTSKDLVNWRPHVHAIFPSQEADINGCWSGSATILPGEKPAILYTGIDSNDHQVQNLAMPKNLSDPFLLEWEKLPNNPLMAPSATNQINSTSFRDPTTAWLGPDGHWRVIIGNKINRKGRAILYRSKDFVHWIKAKHPLHSDKNSGMWECPDFYPVSSSSSNKNGLETSRIGLGIKHVLKMSLDDTKHDIYMLGTYNHVRDKFIPDNTGVSDGSLRYDYGKFYASKTFFDSLKNRRILWGWINESLPKADYILQGWSGIQGIPREVWLDKSGKQLVQWPIQEIESLRENQVTSFPKLLNGGSLQEIKGITAAQADVIVSFKVNDLKEAEEWKEEWRDPQIVCSTSNSKGGKIGAFGLKVLASKDLEEYTAVFFRIFKRLDKYVVLMCSDQSRSSINTSPDKTNYGTFLNVDPLLEGLSLRTLIDHSVVESFGGNGKACITSRVYPTKAIANEAHLYLFNYGESSVSVSNLSAWSMKKARIF